MTALAAWALCRAAVAADYDRQFASPNDYGNAGLLQTPTARMRQDGEFGAGISYAKPYDEIHFFIQWLPWLESTFRYVNDSYVQYGAAAFSGGQHLKDKSFDGKIRLWTEGTYRPELAIGLQDFVGTGDFASQYVVSSYHWYDLDFSFGLAWGRLGTGGFVYNPFRVVSSHFGQDFQASRSGGNFNFSRVFVGRNMAAFGGVKWNTPVPGLSLMVEYDPNNYTEEPANGGFQDLHQASHVNVGASYRLTEGVYAGIGYERGNKLMARFALSTNLETFVGPPKTFDPPPPPARLSAGAPLSVPAASAATEYFPQLRMADRLDPDAASAAPPLEAGARLVLPAQRLGADADRDRREWLASVNVALEGDGIHLIGLKWEPPYFDVTIWLEQTKFLNPAIAVGRVARAVAARTPPLVQTLTVVPVQLGRERYRIVIPRQRLIDAAEGLLDVKTLVDSTLPLPPNPVDDLKRHAIASEDLPKNFFDMGPSIRQYIGGPDSFYLGQLWWRMEDDVQLTNNLTVTGVGGLNIVNNFYKLKQTSNSTLPHVRSDIAQYLKHGKNNLVQLEADYIWSPAPSWYTRVSAGIFEEMYAGVAAQALYRPYGSRWAVGVDMNHVRQRGFNQLLDLRPYETDEMFATLYYQIPWHHLLAQLTVGRYLARDYGATFDLSREFASGAVAGFFFTKTNVSASQFGEGSFDKGIYISIPLDYFFPESSRAHAGILYRPLTRDGGQRAADGRDLWGVTSGAGVDRFERGVGHILQ